VASNVGAERYDQRARAIRTTSYEDHCARSAASRVRRPGGYARSLLRVFTDTLKRSLGLILGKVPNINPIFFSRIWVDFHRGRIESISTILLAAGDPVFLVRLCIPAVAFKARDLSEPTAMVVNRFTRLGEGDPADSCRGPTMLSPLNSMYIRRRSLDIASSPLARSPAVERRVRRLCRCSLVQDVPIVVFRSKSPDRRRVRSLRISVGNDEATSSRNLQR